MTLKKLSMFVRLIYEGHGGTRHSDCACGCDTLGLTDIRLFSSFHFVSFFLRAGEVDTNQ